MLSEIERPPQKIDAHSTPGGHPENSCRMPHEKDLRTGYGWYDLNLCHFWEWLESIADTEIEVRDDFKPFSPSELTYHRNALHEEIEFRANEFIDYKVFNCFRGPLDEDDRMPLNFPNIYTYIHYHLLRFCLNHASWYAVKRLSPPTPPPEIGEEAKNHYRNNVEKAAALEKQLAEGKAAVLKMVEEANHRLEKAAAEKKKKAPKKH